jgi:hypothetical protein
MMRALLALSFGIAACGDSYVVVTVNARPGIDGVAQLAVATSNAGTMQTDTLELGSHQFPVTFSIATSGRSGELDVALQAFGSDGTLLAVGSGSADAGSDFAVTLDPSDFVVNTDFTTDQFLTTDYETKGFQVAATDGGPWTVSFRTTCTNACQIFARMFDPSGEPLKTEVASSTNAFPLTTTATDDQTFPAVAAANASTLDVWDFTSGSGARGIACRGIDASGALTTQDQVTLSTDLADTVTIAPLSTGDFAVTWQTTSPGLAIRTVIAQPDCTPVGGVVTASTTVGTMEGPHRASVADNGASVLYTWITDGAVHARAATPTGGFSGADSVLFPAPTGYTIEQARVAAMGAGFGVAVRLVTAAGTAGGMIQLLLTNAAGQLLPGMPVTISTQTGADFSVGAQGFSIATRSDGATLIAWQQCDDGSPGPCTGHMDVYGALVRDTGALVGTPFEIPTTTTGDQDSPAVAALDGAFAVAWNDSSKTAPDTTSLAVRARVIYPPFDTATRVIGAACRSSTECGDGLACALHSDGTPRCSAVCSTSCARGGTCIRSIDGGSACAL